MPEPVKQEQAKCQLCGQPMPPGEEMFKFHGYSGPCPKLPAEKESLPVQGKKTWSLDEACEFWSVHDPGMWENDTGPKDFYAVSNSNESIVAYFVFESDALRFRMDQINLMCNPPMGTTLTGPRYES